MKRQDSSLQTVSRVRVIGQRAVAPEKLSGVPTVTEVAAGSHGTGSAARSAPPGLTEREEKQPRVRSVQAAGPIVPVSAVSGGPDPAKCAPAAFELDSRPIASLTVDIRWREGEEGKERKKVPPNLAPERLAALRDRAYNALADRQWAETWYLWEAPAFCHQPLYFEEVNLERYGYRWPHASVFQPVLSCAQFYATLPLLPYRLIGESPFDCIYTLGHYRPGSPAPYRVHLPRWRPGAAAGEAGAIAGLILLIP